MVALSPADAAARTRAQRCKVRTLLLALDTFGDGTSLIDTGIRWAKQTDAMLTAVALVDTAAVHQASGPRRESYASVLREEALFQNARQQAERILVCFHARCRTQGVVGRSLQRVGCPAEEILSLADDYDLILTGQRAPFRWPGESSRNDIAQQIVRESPRPVITIPMTQCPLSAVIVAYDGSPPSSRALEAYRQCGLFEKQLTHVVSIDRKINQARRRADEAENYLRFHGYQTRTRALPLTASVAHVLLDQVRQCAGGMLVMGAHGHSAFHQVLHGSTTRALIEQSDVMLFIHP
jgi:nucleotide-binding universal stress UspA family protein